MEKDETWGRGTDEGPENIKMNISNISVIIIIEDIAVIV